LAVLALVVVVAIGSVVLGWMIFNGVYQDVIRIRVKLRELAARFARPEHCSDLVGTLEYGEVKRNSAEGEESMGMAAGAGQDCAKAAVAVGPHVGHVGEQMGALGANISLAFEALDGLSDRLLGVRIVVEVAPCGPGHAEIEAQLAPLAMDIRGLAGRMVTMNDRLRALASEIEL